jgi:hypothetical protein
MLWILWNASPVNLVASKLERPRPCTPSPQVTVPISVPCHV